jgi:uncharacterized protein (TIGR03382 family)
MGATRRLSVLRAAALALSASGAVLMGYSGATGAAVATRAPSAAPIRPAVTEAETREHRCTTPTPESAASRHHLDETSGCGSDAGRAHGTREHDGGDHAAAGHDGRDHGAAGHHARDHGSHRHEMRTRGDQHRGSGGSHADHDTGSSGSIGDSSHRASGVAAGQAPSAAAPLPPAAAGPGGAAGAAGRTTPPNSETTTTSPPSAVTPSAGAGAVAAPLPATSVPAVPVTGVEDTFGAGLLLCLAGLFALLLARRR